MSAENKIVIEIAGSADEMEYHLRKMLADKSGAEQRCISSVEGELKKVNIHGKNTFTIYRDLKNCPPLECKFPPDLMEKVRKGVGRYVSVRGECIYKENVNFPHRIEVNEMELLPDEESQVKLRDLLGIAPDLTGGLSSVEYVRRQRDEWD